jgi:outer membrane protein OmpA-like peptidoglycan-associated protein
MKRLSFLIIFFCTLSVKAQQNERVLLSPTCFNSTGNDYALRFIGEHMFFVSDYKDSSSVKKKDKYSGYRFTDVLEVNSCGFKEAKLVKNSSGEEVSINSQWYDGPISYSKKDSVLFFSNTSEGYQNGMMGIYWSKELKDGTYSDPIPFPLNSREYSCMHPYFDELTSTLYFSSDVAMDSTGFDIYKVSFIKGVFGNPEIIKGLNSTSNELFPSIHNEKIYFTSNRPGGIGGLDLYTWDVTGKLELLGEPFNTNQDDFSLLFVDDKSGYLSSNRTSNGVQDDIFEFYLPPVVKITTTQDDELISLIEGMKNLAKQFKPGSPEAILMAAAIEKLESQQSQMLALMGELNKRKEDMSNYVDTSSFLSFKEKIKIYEELINETAVFAPETIAKIPTEIKQAYIPESNLNKQIKEKQANVLEEKAFFEEKLTEYVTKGNIHTGDLNEIVAHYGISDTIVSSMIAQNYPIELYFGFNRFDLSAEELEKLKSFAMKIKSYKGVIVIEGHTDNIGSLTYNEKLSLKRANHIMQLLLNAGIDQKSINVVAKGETSPIADNATNEGRAKNRRVIIKL